MPLPGLLVDKGMGVDHDFCICHYRSAGTLLAMGGGTDLTRCGR